jgi:hypothetical protein
METKFSKLNISDTKNCSYCNKLFTEELWCKECDPFRIIEEWTSGNPDIDKFIKDTMCKPEGHEWEYDYTFLEWVTFDRFTDIKEIGEGGFAKVFSATWIDGKSSYYKQSDGSWKKKEPKPMKIALKRLNGSQNMTEKYLNEVRFYIPNLIYFIFIV